MPRRQKKAEELTAQGEGRRGLRAAREGELQGPRLGAAGRRSWLGAARHVRRPVRRRAVRDVGGRDPRAGEDRFRLSRAEARRSRGGPRQDASRRRARSSKPNIRKERAQTIFYDESQKLADQAFCQPDRARLRGEEHEPAGEDGHRLHARGRRRASGRSPQSSRQRSARTCSSAGRTARSSRSARIAHWCCA